MEDKTLELMVRFVLDVTSWILKVFRISLIFREAPRLDSTAGWAESGLSVGRGGGERREGGGGPEIRGRA